MGRNIKGTFYREKKLLISQSIKETEFNFIVLNVKFVFLLDVKKIVKKKKKILGYTLIFLFQSFQSDIPLNYRNKCIVQKFDPK